MSVACSPATFFATLNAIDALTAGTANCALVVNPEFITTQLSFRDRDSHFIFCDVATALVLEHEETATAKEQFRALDIKMKTIYSNNIRFGYSYLTRVEPELDLACLFAPDQWFVQQGRRVYKKFLKPDPLQFKVILKCSGT
jgi:beta-ketodecanoyl-[acyl-carrier-protein] synthase